MAVPHIVTGCPCSSTYKPFLSIRQCSGVLTALGIARGYSYHYFKVTLDGKPIVEDYLCAGDYGNNGIGVNLPFYNDLLVEVKDSIPSALTEFWVSYVLLGSELKETRYESREEYIYRIDVFEVKEKTYRVESLERHERISRVALDQDVILPGEKISGKVRLVNWEDEPLYDVTGLSVPVFLQPVARTRVLKSTETGIVKGEGSFAMEPPDFKGSFEVLTNIKGYANVPASLTII